ncbi:MAG: hypothetical protein J0I75_15080 [Hyphomicrobium sp.]|nr:hypothetical protein [Hyphomicrobium sp.]
MRGRLSSFAAWLAFALAFGVTPDARAQSSIDRNAMSRDEIVAAFVDQQLSGIYPSGLPWSELIRADGTSDYREGGNRREGRWWMRGDQFCFRYELPRRAAPRRLPRRMLKGTGTAACGAMMLRRRARSGRRVDLGARGRRRSRQAAPPA